MAREAAIALRSVVDIPLHRGLGDVVRASSRRDGRVGHSIRAHDRVTRGLHSAPPAHGVLSNASESHIVRAHDSTTITAYDTPMTQRMTQMMGQEQSRPDSSRHNI